MTDSFLLPQLISASAARTPESVALTAGNATLTYAALERAVTSFASALVSLDLQRGERVGVYLEKRPETVIGLFGASAGGVQSCSSG